MIPYAGFDPTEKNAPVPARTKKSATSCKNDHLFDKKNTYWVTIRGTRCRRCRECLRLYNNLRYKTNAAYREQQKALAKANYWRKKR